MAIPSNAESTAATVLVVDDNAANRSLARETLEDEGYRVIAASGGAEGIALFARERPDCVLLDIRMAGMDGFTVCEKIRAFPWGHETPVLFLTALRDIDTFDHAIRSGGDDYLTKPVRPVELVARVRSALRMQRMSVELRGQYALLRRERDALLRLQLQKERLIAFVVHDLKTPVNAIDLHAQLLIRDNEVHGKARDSATKIRANVRDLTNMLHNLLDISRADEGQLAPRRSELDLQALVDELTSDLRFSAESRNVTLRSLLATGHLYADGDLLRRTLTNLVENAIRYAPPETSVTISAVSVADGTELRVADRGPGIPAELRESIFDAFAQVESGERVLGHVSHGLGLTFCKRIIEAHGGRIWIEDAAPGTQFCMRLPHGP